MAGLVNSNSIDGLFGAKLWRLEVQNSYPLQEEIMSKKFPGGKQFFNLNPQKKGDLDRALRGSKERANTLELEETGNSCWEEYRINASNASIPNCVLIIAKYQYQIQFVADQEINTLACLTEIMLDGVEWKSNASTK